MARRSLAAQFIPARLNQPGNSVDQERQIHAHLRRGGLMLWIAGDLLGR
jgi:hypothetical protein